MLAGVALGVCLLLPTNAGVIDPFREPPCARCAGNRGVELAVDANSAVPAGLAGTVTFAGRVAQYVYVVVRSTDDPTVRVTYGRLSSVAVQRGDTVVVGTPVGVANPVLFVGVRVGDEYVDPLRLTNKRVVHSGSRPRFRVTLGANAPYGGTTAVCR